MSDVTAAEGPWGITTSTAWETRVEERLHGFLAASVHGAELARRRLGVKVNDLLRGAGMRKRVSQDDLQLILVDGYLKTAFEIEPRWPEDWPDELKKKAALEQQLFSGYGQPDQHIVYGYPSDSDEEFTPNSPTEHVLSGYGTVILELDASALTNVTATLCDTGWLTKWGQEPEVAATDFMSPRWTSGRQIRNWEPLTLDEILESEGLAASPTEYAEIQVHQRVEHVHIASAHLTEEPKGPLKEHLLANPAGPIEVRGPSGEVLMERHPTVEIPASGADE